MKLSYQILIIVFVVISLFVIKDDMGPIYDRVHSYAEKIFKFNDNTLSSSNRDKSKINTGAPEAPAVPKKEVTPGPLRVISNIFTSGSTNGELSAKNVITITNRNRAENGSLPALKENAKLDASAEIKLKDMFAKQYFEHISPNGIGVSDLGKEVGYEYIIIGENLALGSFTSDKALVDAWMASPGHRANILNKHYTQIGVAVGKGTFEGKTTWLAVQHFGLPKDACPSTDEVLHGKITIDQQRARSMELDMAERRARIDSGAVYEGKTTNEQIEEYNNLVGIYNELVINLKQEINTYNEGIRALNACIAANT